MIGRAPRLVIVGAGPAGLTAAATGSRLGFDVTVIDENRTLGGQYFRGRQASRNPGSPEWFRRRAATHVLLDTTVFDVPADDVVSVWSRARGSQQRSFDALIVATGAYDRPVPVPGWTMPGVFTAGGAHTLAKAYGVIAGARVVVAGSGPFLLPVADVLAAHGASTTVVEATPLATSVRGLRSIVRDRELLGQTIGYLARLTARGVGRRYGEIVTEIHGDRRVEAATISAVDNEWQPLAGSERTLGADAVCLGYGFVPQLEVAQLAGCTVTYLEDSSDFAVWTDADMRTSKPRIYAAGEVTGIAGVRAAVLKGALAALAAATDLDVGTPADRERRQRAIGARLERLRPTAEWIRQAFRPRPGLWKLASADTLICRCEDVSLGQVEDVLALNAVSPFAVKTATRLGMGLCQGRICSPYVIERLRAVHGYVVPREGRPWVVRPPLRPILLGSLAAGFTPRVEATSPEPATAGTRG